MSVSALLIAHRAHRVHLRVAGDDLLARPLSVIPPELREAMRAHKLALLALPRPSLRNGELVIPADAAPQYHWQPLRVTLEELGASPEVMARYVGERQKAAA